MLDVNARSKYFLCFKNLLQKYVLLILPKYQKNFKVKVCSNNSLS